MKKLKGKKTQNHTYPVCRWNVAKKRWRKEKKKSIEATTAVFNCRNKMTDWLKNIPLWIRIDNKINFFFKK